MRGERQFINNKQQQQTHNIQMAFKNEREMQHKEKQNKLNEWTTTCTFSTIILEKMKKKWERKIIFWTKQKKTSVCTVEFFEMCIPNYEMKIQDLI